MLGSSEVAKGRRVGSSTQKGVPQWVHEAKYRIAVRLVRSYGVETGGGTACFPERLVLLRYCPCRNGMFADVYHAYHGNARSLSGAGGEGGGVADVCDGEISGTFPVGVIFHASALVLESCEFCLTPLCALTCLKSSCLS